MPFVLGLVEAEGVAEAARRLPRLRDDLRDVRVLAGEEAVVRNAPAVVDDAVGYGVEVPLQERGDRVLVPPLAAVGPLDVVPEHVRGEARHELVQLRGRVAREVLIVAAVPEEVRVGLDGREVAHVPVERPGVVDAEVGARSTRRVVELGDQVAARTPCGRVEAGRGGVPQAEALVVLRRRHDVLRPRSDELTHERIRIEGGSIPQIRQVLVRGPRAVLSLVPLPRRAAGDAHGVAVPLRILVPGVGVFGGDVHSFPVPHRPRRHRVQAPVHEEAELRVAVPLGHALRRIHGGVRPEIGAGALLEVHQAFCSSAAPRRTTTAVRSGRPSGSKG